MKSDNVPNQEQKSESAAPQKPSQQEERKSDILRVLTDMNRSDPEAFFSGGKIADCSGAAFEKARAKRNSLTSAVNRALTALIEDGLVEKGTNGYRIARKTKNKAA